MDCLDWVRKRRPSSARPTTGRGWKLEDRGSQRKESRVNRDKVLLAAINCNKVLWLRKALTIKC